MGRDIAPDGDPLRLDRGDTANMGTDAQIRMFWRNQMVVAPEAGAVPAQAVRESARVKPRLLSKRPGAKGSGSQNVCAFVMRSASNRPVTGPSVKP